MAFLMLYGAGWTQRWRIAPAMEEHVRIQVAQVGSEATGNLPVIDPGSEERTNLMVAWRLVAAAVVLDGSPEGESDTSGQYA